MLQAQQQRKMAQKSTSQTPAASLPASSAPSEDGTTVHNGTAAETLSTPVVPDTDVDSDCEASAPQPSVAAASHDSDTEVGLLATQFFTADDIMQPVSYTHLTLPTKRIV